MTVVGSLLLLLASVSIAAAAPHTRQANRRALRHATFHPPVVLCDPRVPEAPALQRIANQTKAVGGPVAKRLRKSRLDLHHSVLSRNTRTSQNDEQAIQNDTIAAGSAVDLALMLRPLGFFVEAFEQHPLTLAFSPRSPRGPPQRAIHPFTAPGGFVKFEVSDAGSSSRPEV